MKALQRWVEATMVDRVWEHYGGDIPQRLAAGEASELAQMIGCALSGVPGVLHDLRKHGSPEAARAWRNGYQARYRVTAG